MSENTPRGPVGFWQELTRRRVVRVAVLYIAVAWAVIEVADTVVPYVGLPDRVVTLIIILAALGLPLALVLAWAYRITPEGVETDGLEGEAGSARPVREWRNWALAALTAVVIATVVLVARGVRQSGISDSPPSPSVVAVMPFSVRGDTEYDDFGAGIVGLLGTKLDGAGALRTVDSRALLSFMQRADQASMDPESAHRVALQFGAGFFVLGDVLQVGDRIEVNASVYPTESRPRAVVTASVENASDSLFSMIDQLAAQLLAGMAGGLGARVTRIAAVTTESLPALRAFLEGERLERGAQFGTAVDAYRRAVELDSVFALAHYRLAVTAEWSLQEDLARAAADQAVRNAGRLSERDRRLLEAFSVRRRGANAEAAQMYRSILGTWPDEIEAWIDLTEVLFHVSPLQGRSFTISREALERTLYFEDTHSTSLIHLARVAAFEGRLEEMDSLAAKFLSLNPDADRGYEIRALQIFAHGEPAAIGGILQELRAADDQSVALAAWDVAVFARSLDGAIQLCRVLVQPSRSPEARTLGYAWLASLLAAKGQLAAAGAEIDALEAWNAGVALENRILLAGLPFLPHDAPALRRDRAALERLDPRSIPVSHNPSVVFTAHDALHPILREYLLGLASVRLGELDRAARHADRVEAMKVPATAGSLAGDLARSLRAQLQRQAGDPARALATLEGARMETWYGQTLASPFYAQVLERFLRAELLVELNRETEALDWYAHIAELSPFETPYRAISHLRQAVIHERAGNAAEARSHAALALEIWIDADPSLAPLIDEARRIAGSQG
ncbi:MAG: hypothetical protein L0271_13335 [Gemmatimonadetes bacterium]|nr:hypothetical protein [Gemmatimonadota bacterium]